ncbi:hypothetical protein HDU76_006994, partial [Blyttiomyces sp. JEL0837]
MLIPERNHEQRTNGPMPPARSSSLHPAMSRMQLSSKIIFGIPPKDQEYDAISHVWGKVYPQFEPKLNRNVLISSLSKWYRLQQIIMATKNRVWIDIISINQDDKDDKCEQIGAMKDIYKNATTVYALIGDTDYARFENVAVSLVVRHEDGAGLSGFPVLGGGFKRYVNKFSKLKAQVQQSIELWDGIEYNRRAWTRQELSLAQEIIFCKMDPHTPIFTREMLDAIKPNNNNNSSNNSSIMTDQLSKSRLFKLCYEVLLESHILYFASDVSADKESTIDQCHEDVNNQVQRIAGQLGSFSALPEGTFREHDNKSYAVSTFLGRLTPMAWAKMDFVASVPKEFFAVVGIMLPFANGNWNYETTTPSEALQLVVYQMYRDHEISLSVDIGATTGSTKDSWLNPHTKYTINNFRQWPTTMQGWRQVMEYLISCQDSKEFSVLQLLEFNIGDVQSYSDHYSDKNLDTLGAAADRVQYRYAGDVDGLISWMRYGLDGSFNSTEGDTGLPKKCHACKEPYKPNRLGIPHSCKTITEVIKRMKAERPKVVTAFVGNVSFGVLLGPIYPHVDLERDIYIILGGDQKSAVLAQESTDGPVKAVQQCH